MTEQTRKPSCAAVAGQPGEPCEECGAPLAADQRYCLNCGRRRGGPRVDYRQLHGVPRSRRRPEAEPRAAATSRPWRSRPAKPRARLRAAGGGRRDRRARPDAADRRPDRQGRQRHRPPRRRRRVVRVPAAEAAKKAPKAARASKNTGGGLGGRRRKKAKKARQERQQRTPATPSRRAPSDLEALEQRKRRRATRRQSAKLPDEIATPGSAAAERQTKPPGGGEAEGKTIE